MEGFLKVFECGMQALDLRKKLCISSGIAWMKRIFFQGKRSKETRTSQSLTAATWKPKE